LQGRPAEPQLLHRVRPEVLQHHVGDLDQLPENVPPLLTFQVKDEALLVAVQADEVRAAVLVVAAHEGAELPGVVPDFALDVDDLGAQIGQIHAGRRRRQHVAQVHYPYALQRSWHKMYLRDAGLR
jgi:hypothetical protein